MNHNESGTIAIGAPGSAMRRITEPAEPKVESMTNYNVRTQTPWGTAQSATQCGRGIVLYSTASHGGFHVSAELLKQMPEYLRIADKYADGNAGWFEEDCGVALVVISFPERFSMKWRETAIDIMKMVYPDQWKQFCQAH